MSYPGIYLDIPNEFKRPYVGPIPRVGDFINLYDEREFYRRVEYVEYITQRVNHDDSVTVPVVNVRLSEKIHG